MKSSNVWVWAAAAFLAALPKTGMAQGISVTALAGAYAPGGSFRELQTQAEDKLARESTLGVGVNVSLGLLRASVAYASGAKISRKGVSATDDIGDGSVLTAALDLVLRPLPKLLIVQPYLLGGAGYKREQYSIDQQGLPSDIQDDANKFVLHFGAGVDVGLGPLNLVAEVTDFIGRNNQDELKVHDAFAMVGLKFRLF